MSDQQNVPTAARTAFELIESLNQAEMLEYLFEDCPGNPFKNLRVMQKLILDVASQRSLTFVAAPSQSGKSTTSLGFIVPVLFIPNGLGMFVSNSEKNRDELMARFIVQILGDPKAVKALAQHAIIEGAKGIDCPPIIEIEGTLRSVKPPEEIRIAATGTRVIARIASVNATTGMSPDRLVLDEMATWSKKVASHIFAECLARVGNSEGKVLAMSTVRGEGKMELLPNGSMTVEGDTFYAYMKYLTAIQTTQRHVAALNFTYHASEKLLKTVPLSVMTTEQKKHHYWGIPMESDLEPLFSMFSYEKHTIPTCATREQLDVSHDDVWAFSVDPGSATSAISLIQKKNTGAATFIIHRTWDKKKQEDFTTFLENAWYESVELLKEQSHKLQVIADVASRQRQGPGSTTFEQQIQHVTKRNVRSCYMDREESTRHMISYIEYSTHKGVYFKVAQSCHELLTALRRAKPLVDKDTNQPMIVYAKDGKTDHCFVAGTLVTTDRGEVPIEDVTTEDKVLTRDGYKPVIASGISGFNRETITVETEHGNVTCTPEHLIWTENKGWTRADALRYDDVVIVCVEQPLCQNIQPTKMLPIGDTQNQKTYQTETISDAQTGIITQNMNPIYTDKSGLIISETSQRGTTSITKMGTPETTTQTTSNVYQQKNTMPTTQNNQSQKNGCAQTKNILRESTTLLNRGTQAQKVCSGTKKTEKECGNPESIKTETVTTAKCCLKQKHFKKQKDSAQTSVSLHGEDEKDSITKQNLVKNVENCTHETNTVKHVIAASRVLGSQITEIAPLVYDLTVQDKHEFFANGILVHNCLDSVRYAMYLLTYGASPYKNVTINNNQCRAKNPYA
jgi:Intein splicing domain